MAIAGLSPVLTAAAGWAILGLTTPRPLQAMSEEQLKAFLEAVKADAGLQEQLKAAADADAVVALAKAAGFLISVDELKKAQSEISEEELEGVAGGQCFGSTVLTKYTIFCTAYGPCAEQ